MEISTASITVFSFHSYRLSHAVGSSQIYCAHTPVSKPIAYHSFPKIKKRLFITKAGAYLASPLDDGEEDEENLSDKARELQSTLRLVECAMFAAIAGLAYFLSNLLRIEWQRKIDIPLIRSHAVGSSQIYGAHTPVSKPVAYHSFPKIKKRLFIREAGAYLANPLDDGEEDEENLSDKARELQSTLRLVECAMFAAITGLAYFLSNLLRIEV